MSPIPPVAALLALLSTGALAENAAAPLPTLAVLSQQAAKRFPQPVRAVDLVGRDVLGPREAQPVLGRVAALRHRTDGGWDVIMRIGGLLGIGTHLVAVPTEAVALLGEHLALLGYTPAQLQALPPAALPDAAVSPGEQITVALVKPFH